MTEPSKHGVLLAIMEPDAGQDEEFNDWYDLEHIPHMSGVTGVLTATRWICVEGWPRYLAVYDLEDIEVLKSDSYRGATGSHFTPWTRRILSRVRGWRRVPLAGCVAGAPLTDPETTALDLFMVDGAEPAAALAEALAPLPGVIRARAFESRDGGPAAVLVEAGALAELPRDLPAGTGPLSGWSRYVRYQRGEPLSAFRAIDAGETH